MSSRINPLVSTRQAPRPALGPTAVEQADAAPRF